jgi:hypothetical protein
MTLVIIYNYLTLQSQKHHKMDYNFFSDLKIGIKKNI